MPALHPESTTQADTALNVSHLPADGLHVHDKEGEHLCRPRRAWRQGGRGRLRKADDTGAHPAAA